MADEHPDSGTSKAKPALPPLRSSVPVGGGGPRQAAPAPAKPVTPARPAPAPPVRDEPKPQVPPQAGQQVSPPTESAPSAPSPRLTAAPRKAKQDKPPENDPGVWRISRKNFLNVAGWFAFFSFLATATVGALRLMFPRVLYEPPSAFKAGFPEEYIVGEVNETYKDEFRVWIVRETEGFYALSAICTHLGCTPRWLPTEKKFRCPCHGSGYRMDGVNFEGPTPRPLERLQITLADDGKILIDRNIKFLYEKQEWSKPGAYLKYS
jgi:cytochrome b6-f complex iron-sulfur subunit